MVKNYAGVWARVQQGKPVPEVFLPQEEISKNVQNVPANAPATFLAAIAMHAQFALLETWNWRAQSSRRRDRQFHPNWASTANLSVTALSALITTSGCTE